MSEKRPYYIGEKSATHTYRGVVRIAKSLGIAIHETERSKMDDHAAGWAIATPTDGKVKYDILIAKELSLEEKRLTLAHEMAHIILGHIAGDYIGDQYNVSHSQAEFEAEALGLILYNFLYGMRLRDPAANHEEKRSPITMTAYSGKAVKS